MVEFEVAPGRYLVGVNMGKGYEQFNDPEKAVEILDFNRKYKGRKFRKDMEENHLANWTWDLSMQYGDLDKFEQMHTAMIEYAWLTGKPILRRLLGND